MWILQLLSIKNKCLSKRNVTTIFDMSETRVCIKCGSEKNALTDFRSKNVCKECRKAIVKAYEQTEEAKDKTRARRKTPKYEALIKQYAKSPERRAKARKYDQTPGRKAQRKTPEYKEKVRVRMQDPERKERDRVRQHQPEAKARRIAYQKTAKAKAIKLALQQTPEAKARQKEYQQKFGGRHHRRAEKHGNYVEKVKRIDIFKRDKFICEYCQTKLNPKDCVLEHRIPIARGGSNTPANCTTSCKSCNMEKSVKLLNGIQITIFDRVKT